jgi:hypothetical protein
VSDVDVLVHLGRRWLVLALDDRHRIVHQSCPEGSHRVRVGHRETEVQEARERVDIRHLVQRQVEAVGVPHDHRAVRVRLCRLGGLNSKDRA